MNHEEAHRLLDDYADGTLPPGETAGVRDHLRRCEVCRRRLAQTEALIVAARNLPRDVEPERDLWPAVAARTREEKREVRIGVFERLADFWGGRHPWWRMAFATAALVAVVLAVTLRGRDVAGPPRVETPVAVVEPAGPDAGTAAVLEALEAECEETEQQMNLYAASVGGLPFLEPILANLRMIDLAISELRAAWSSDPGSPRLARMLAAAYRTKAVLQGKAARLAAEVEPPRALGNGA